MAGVLEDDLVRAGYQFGEHVGVADVDQTVAVAPHDQRGAGDLGQALAEVVVEDRLERLQEAGLAGAAQLLGGEGGGQTAGVAL